MALDYRGREIPDPTPIEIPAHLQRPLTLQEEIKRFIRVEASLAAQAADMESFEEADDFDIDDSEIDDMLTPYYLIEKTLAPESGDLDTIEGANEPETAPTPSAPTEQDPQD